MPIIQRYNPVSGHFDLVNTSSGGTNPIWGYVANYSALPLGVTPSDPAIGDLVGANASQGIYWINYRANGFYKRIALTGVAATDYGTTPFASFSNAADQATVDAAAVGDQYVSPITMAGAAQFQYLDATSSIQTQLNAATSSLGSPLNITNPQTHTGTTAEIIMPIACPNLVGVLATDDVFNLMLYLQATNSGNSKTVKFYISDSQDVLLNEVLIGTATGTTGFINTARIEKIMSMTSLTTQLVVAGTTTGIAGWGTIMSGLSIDFSTGTKYLCITFQLALSSETMKLQFAFSQINRKF